MAPKFNEEVGAYNVGEIFRHYLSETSLLDVDTNNDSAREQDRNPQGCLRSR